MRLSQSAVVAMLLIVPVALDGQMRGRRGTSSSGPVHPEPYKGVIVTFHGALKKLTKKEIIIESDDNHQLLTFRRNKTTKFLENDAEVKSSAIDMESAVSVDAAEDVDLKLMAITVSVAGSKKDDGETKRK